MNSPVKNWRETKKLHEHLGKVGIVITWTKIYVAPSGFELEAPYIVAIVKFDNGKKMTAQVVDCDEGDMTENMKVITVVRRIGRAAPEDVIEYGIKVKPL